MPISFLLIAYDPAKASQEGQIDMLEYLQNEFDNAKIHAAMRAFDSADKIDSFAATCVSDLLTTDPENYEDPYQCDNCGAVVEREDLPDAKDLSMRLTPGGIYTDKECSECGALSFPLRGRS